MGAIEPLDPFSYPWPSGVAPVGGGVCAAEGIAAAGVVAGIKKSGRLDVALIVADGAPEQDGLATAAGVFTSNALAASCVHVTRSHVSRGHLKAIVVSAGNANACTGAQGFDDTVSMATNVASHLGCDSWDVGVASTGVIGVPLPIDAVTAGIEAAADRLSADGGGEAAEAITTTDTFPKEVAVEVELAHATIRIGGMAKGSGMIRPDMATMLAFVTTDAGVTGAQARQLLGRATDVSFNRITVDGETSTNDMVLLMATGRSAAVEPGSADESLLAAALEAVCGFLAQQIVRDGEGATKCVRIDVAGGADEAQATAVAFTVAGSPLVKAALFGEDPNWGRVLAAIGNSGQAIEPDRVAVRFGSVLVAASGARADFDESDVAAHLRRTDIDIAIDLGLGEGHATVWTTDLSYDYVRINSEYRT